MKIIVEQTIDLPIDKVWQTFGHEFADIQNWSDFVKKSIAKTSAELVGDATISGRNCETELGNLDETLQIFENETHELKFLVKSDGFPFFMRSILSHWKFFEVNGQTLAKTEVNIDLMFPFSFIMALPIRRSFTKAINGVGSELEVYVKSK